MKLEKYNQLIELLNEYKNESYHEDSYDESIRLQVIEVLESRLNENLTESELQKLNDEVEFIIMSI